MINVSYVHQFDEIDKINNDYMEAKNEIDSIYEPILFLKEKIENEIFFNESIDEDLVMYENMKEDFFTRIGNTIIKIIKRCREFIEEKVDAIRQFSWNRKSDLDKKEMILKKCPNLSERVKVALDENVIDLSSLKDFKDFNENYLRMLDEIDKAEDESKFRKKWEGLKKKFSDNADTIIKAGQVATAIITIAGLLTLGKKIRNDINKVDINQMADQARVTHEATERKIDALKKMNEKKDGLEVPHWKGYMLAEMAADNEKITKGYVSKMASIKVKATSMVDKMYSTVLPKASEKNSKKIMNNAQTKYTNIANAAKNTYTKIDKQNLDRARATEYAKRVGIYQFSNDYPTAKK